MCFHPFSHSLYVHLMWSVSSLYFLKIFPFFLLLGREIEMTAPVVVKIVDKRFWEMGVYTMSFLLPAEYQSNPPKPTDEKVRFSGTKMLGKTLT